MPAGCKPAWCVGARLRASLDRHEKRGAAVCPASGDAPSEGGQEAQATYLGRPAAVKGPACDGAAMCHASVSVETGTVGVLDEHLRRFCSLGCGGFAFVNHVFTYTRAPCVPTCLEPPSFSLTCRVWGPLQPVHAAVRKWFDLCMLCAAALCTAHLDTIWALPGYAVPKAPWVECPIVRSNQIASQQARFCHHWEGCAGFEAASHVLVSAMTVQCL